MIHFYFKTLINNVRLEAGLLVTTGGLFWALRLPGAFFMGGNYHELK